MASSPHTGQNQPPQDPSETPLCLLRQELELSGNQGTGLGYRTIYDPANGRFFRIDRMTFVILRYWRMGKAGLVAEAVNSSGEYEVTVADVLSVNSFLRQQFLCQADEQNKPQILKVMRSNGDALGMLLKQYLFLKFPLFSPGRFLDFLYPKLSFLFRRGFWWTVFFVALLSLLLIMQRWDAFIHSMAGFWSLEGATAYAAVIIISKVFHEMGHALTLRHFGQKVTSMGIAIMMLMPMFYTDASESWKLTEPKARMSVAAAGILAEILLATIGSIGWILLDDGPWRSACYIVATTNWIMTIFFNMNPLMRFDGYFVLSDYLKIENLHSRALGQLKKILAWHLFRLPVRYAEVFSPKKTISMVLFGICVLCYRLSIIAGIIALVYYFFFKALAILLLVHQIWRSLIMPLKTFVKWLWTNKMTAKITPSFVILCIFLCSILVSLFIPFNYSICAEGNLRSEEQSTVYVPYTGVVKQVLSPNTRVVKKGDLILTMSSPEVDYQLAQATSKAASLEKELSVMAFDITRNEKRLIRIEELKKSRELEKNLQNEIKKMQVRATDDAWIDWLEKGSLEGVWLGADQPIARLNIINGNQKVVTYISEIDRERIHEGSKAYFYPNADTLTRIPLTVTYIGDHAEQQLKEPIFDAKYGGELLTEGKTNRIIGSYYRVELVPEINSQIDAMEVSGNVQISSEGMSAVYYTWRKIKGLFLRETSF